MGDKTNDTFASVSVEVKYKINSSLEEEFNKLALSDTSYSERSVRSGQSDTRRSDNWAQPIDKASSSDHRYSEDRLMNSSKSSRVPGLPQQRTSKIELGMPGEAVEGLG